MNLKKRVFCVNDVGWGRTMHGFIILISVPGPKYGHICEVVDERSGGYILKEWPEEKEGWQKDCFIELECDDEATISSEINEVCSPKKEKVKLVE